MPTRSSPPPCRSTPICWPAVSSTNPGGQFLFTAVPDSTAQGVTPYDPNSDPNALPNATSGDILVKEGAMITSPRLAGRRGRKDRAHRSQRHQPGHAFSTDGQIILAAGEQVGFVPHPGTDPSLRGLDVAVGVPTPGRRRRDQRRPRLDRGGGSRRDDDRLERETSLALSWGAPRWRSMAASICSR